MGDLVMSLVDYPDNKLTPWEQRGGLWFKREDLLRNSYGVNGAKFRVCRHLITRAVVETGADHIVTAQSVRSPQAAITATLCEELGLKCTVVVGASKPHTAVKHRSIEIAMAAGAQLDTTPRMAYNNVIQPYGAQLARELGGWQVPYAISPPADAPREDVEAALAVGGRQVENLPKEITDLVIPFGSGNTTAGILYGLQKYGEESVEKIHLVGVGPDRYDWLQERLAYVGAPLDNLAVDLEVTSLHGWFAEYADLMPETLEGIELHPTYEGKVARFLNSAEPEWWTRRDGTVGFWIVGGPF